jgi:tetratricopeptide (TPR) repeat protein
MKFHANLGRNRLCHCGSGRKYKVCHLQADREAAGNDEQSARVGEKVVSLPDRRLMESTMRDLRDMFAGGSRVKRAAIDEAQEMMYSAWEARSPERRITLARKALQVSEDCADAYVLLAQEASRSEEDAKDLYEKGVAAGKRAIGPRAFRSDVGHFWGILETRPYMRALHGLAECLWHLDQRDAAIDTYSEMLRLNPNDNQGARYQLAACLLETGRNDELRALLGRYEGDGTAYWNFSTALLDFRAQGDSENARMALVEAIASNKNVPPYLLGHRKLPQTLPDYVGVGDEKEAIAYAADNADAWKVTPGALEWLAGQAPTSSPSKVRGRRSRRH